MKNFFLFVFILAVISCKKEAKNEEISAQKTTSDSIQNADLKTIAFEEFGMLPEIVGCSCYFAKSKTDFENRNYLYADDYGNAAYIKINGKIVKIPMEEGDFDPQNFSKTIENADYKLEIKAKKIKTIVEVVLFQGEMTIENKNGQKTATPIYGTCGC